MLTFDTYSRMRDLSTDDAYGLGEIARFKNGSSFPKYGYAMWAKNHESITVQGGPLYWYASSGTPDGRLMYNKDGTGSCLAGACVGAAAYNGTVDFTAYTLTYGYLWCQIGGASSASAALLSFNTSTAADVAAGDLIFPAIHDDDGYWQNGAIYINIDLTASTYIRQMNPMGFAQVIDTTTTGVIVATGVIWQSPWMQAGGF